LTGPPPENCGRLGASKVGRGFYLLLLIASSKGIFSRRRAFLRCTKPISCQNGQRGHHGLKIFSTFGLLRFDCTFHPVPELRYRDGGDFKPVVWKRCDPAPQIKDAPFAANDDIGIEHYYHLSVGGLRR